MFSIRVHSVDSDHPLFLSPPSNTNPNSSNQFSERRGIIHLYRTLISLPSTSHPSLPTVRSTLLFIVAVPIYFSSDDLFCFFGSLHAEVTDSLIIRNDGVEDRYSVLIRTADEDSADAFCRAFNGKRFSPPEIETCHILSVDSLEFTELAEIASTPPDGYTELPTCPICLERLDQDTNGIQNTECDHLFECSCSSKWTYLSCQVCRLCQQQDDYPNCSVCDTSENVWVCITCGFVGCGRYKEGHMHRHWKDKQHCYSIDIETRRVWDYEADTYVQRLNYSKAEGKSLMVNSHCVSHDGDCGNCGDGEVSKLSWAQSNSKIEETMEEFNHRLATELENQRQNYESQLAEARSKRDNIFVEEAEKASKLQDLQCKLEKYEEDKKTLLNENHILIKEQEEYKKLLTAIEERETSYVTSRNKEILELEEQIRDLKFYIAAQMKLSSTADSQGIKGGTVLPVPEMEPPPTKTKRRTKSGRHCN